MEESNGFRVTEKLTAENYHEWKFNMKMVLIGKDLWEIVEGTELMPTTRDANRLSKFRKRENQALALICLSVSPSLQIYVRSAKTGKEAWDSLAKRFEEKTLTRIISYRRQLYSTRMVSGSMIDHVNNLKTISERLESLDDGVAEKDLVMILISSLPENYNNLITTLETLKQEDLTWDYVRDRVISEYERRNGENRRSTKFDGDDALYVGNMDGNSYSVRRNGQDQMYNPARNNNNNNNNNNNCFDYDNNSNNKIPFCLIMKWLFFRKSGLKIIFYF